MKRKIASMENELRENDIKMKLLEEQQMKYINELVQKEKIINSLKKELDTINNNRSEQIAKLTSKLEILSKENNDLKRKCTPIKFNNQVSFTITLQQEVDSVNMKNYRKLLDKKMAFKARKDNELNISGNTIKSAKKLRYV